MGKKMLFHYNNYKGIGQVPKKSVLFLDILYCKSDDYIVRIMNKIEDFSKYKKPGSKRTLTHVQYVYRKMTNVEAFKSIISTLSNENAFRAKLRKMGYGISMSYDK